MLIVLPLVAVCPACRAAILLILYPCASSNDPALCDKHSIAQWLLPDSEHIFLAGLFPCAHLTPTADNVNNYFMQLRKYLLQSPCHLLQ
jgi:hypothetical protein